MPLVFPENAHPLLAEELGLAEFLNKFQAPVPILGKTLLKPLEEPDAIDHFDGLQTLDQKIHESNLSAQVMLQYTQKLPSLEAVFTALQHQSLEQYELRILAEFLSIELHLFHLESSFSPIDEEESLLSSMLTILEKTLENGYESLRGNENLKLLQSRLESIEKELDSKVAVIEELIFSETGLKITYPYPREKIDIENSSLKKLKDCSLVSVTEETRHTTIEVKLPLDIQRLEQDQSKALLSFDGEVQQILRGINTKISPLFERFKKHYSKRKVRAFEYLLLASAHESKLVLPELTQEPNLEIVHGKLPILSDRKENYLPLDLSLDKNVQVLVGSNMTGKTTILKTLYFLFFLTRHGLPVPAQKMRLKFPSGIFIHLPNPGDLQKNLSALGDELEFWSRDFPENSLVLVDELFQSTDPVSGARLSRIFLEEFRNSGIFLLVTSHYSQVLKVPGLRFLRMQNYGKASPFQPDTEPLSGIESEVLKSALGFLLPDRVIDRIKQRIQSLRKTKK